MKDVKILLDHILECIKLIENYIKEQSKDDFINSIQLQDAIIRRIEIIGEAAKYIPEDIKDKYTTIQWKKIAGMVIY